jgi:hypothetical protein
VSFLALILLLLTALAPALILALRKVDRDPTVALAVLAGVLLAAAALFAAYADPTGGWRRGAALVLGVAAATTAGSDVVRGTFRLTRGELLPPRRRRPRPGPDETGSARAHDGLGSDPDSLADEAAVSGDSGTGDHATTRDSAATGDIASARVGDGEFATGGASSPGTVLRGGAWVGYLERAAISATLLAGWPEGMALVLAVKGVGRYPELVGPASVETHAPETFIIGTLASVLWAAACAGAAVLIYR